MDERQVGRELVRAIRHVAEPRRGTAARQEAQNAALSPSSLPGDEFDVIIFSYSRFDTHKFGEIGPVVFS